MAKKKAKKKTSIKAAKKTSPRPPQVTPHPTAEPRVKEFEAELDRQLNSDISQEPKRGPGRPRKEPPPAQPETPQGPQLQEKVIDRMLRMPFAIWATNVGVDEIKLQDREAADLAAVTKELLDFYFPNLPIHLVLWANFAAAAAIVLQPRFKKIQDLKKQKKARSAQRPEESPEGPVVSSNDSTKFPTEINPEKVQS